MKCLRFRDSGTAKQSPFPIWASLTQTQVECLIIHQASACGTFDSNDLVLETADSPLSTVRSVHMVCSAGAPKDRVNWNTPGWTGN